MIHLSFNIRNPWSRQFKNLWALWAKTFNTPFAHKYIELEVYRDSSLLCCNVDWSIRQNHAGLDFEIGVLGYCFRSNFYDSRHWDYYTNSYI